MTAQKEFLILTEEEHDIIQKLWREIAGTLIQRYLYIEDVILSHLAIRLGCAWSEVPREYHDQIAYGVIGCAIQDNLLKGSAAGELIAELYYYAGGTITLESYGRFCFCPRTKPLRPASFHATNCDTLWRAWCDAVDATLQRPNCQLRQQEDFCILDTTVDETASVPDRSLQQDIAKQLSQRDSDVQRMWEMFPLPTEEDEDMSSSIALALKALQMSMRKHNTSLFLKTVVLVVGATTPNTVIAEFVLQLRQWTATRPIVLGVESCKI